MKTNKLLFIWILFIPLVSLAQKKLTIEDASGMNRDLYPTSLRNLQWIGSEDSFSWMDNNALITRKATSTVSDTILTLKAFNQDLAKGNLDTLSRFPSVTWQNDDSFRFSAKNAIYIYNLRNHQVKHLVGIFDCFDLDPFGKGDAMFFQDRAGV